MKNLKKAFAYIRTEVSGLHQPNEIGVELGIWLRLAAKGVISLDRLYDELTKLNNGKPMGARKFKRIVLNPYYAGILRYRNEEFKGKHAFLIAGYELANLKALFNE